MSTITLTDRAAGQTILDTFFNDIHSALEGDFVGRNSSGVPAGGQNLGTVAFPWGTVRSDALILAGSSIDPSKITSPVNRVTSGKTRSTSNQPAFITPNGSALSFIVAGASTNLVYDVNGSATSIVTDITKGSLTAAPSTQNTALIVEANAAGQSDTRTWGEKNQVSLRIPFEDGITIGTVGTNITALVGKWAAFKNGTTSEYFLAFVESTTKLSKCKRGYFFDSTLAPNKREVFSNGDTLTLMQLGWVFAENNGTTIDVTYTNPVWSFNSPSSPSAGDYWYDLGNSIWKRYDGVTFQIINRTYIAQVIMNTTACIGARCVDFYAAYSKDNGLLISLETTSIARAMLGSTFVNVAGKVYSYYDFLPEWNVTTQLAGAADMYNPTLQVSTNYYLYVKDDGNNVISDIEPYYRPDLQGEYHPHNPWRCVGETVTDSSGDLLIAGDKSDKGVFCALYINPSTTPSFPASTQTGVPFDFQQEDQYGCGKFLGTTSAAFVAPRSGVYDFQAAVETPSVGTSGYCLFNKNAGASSYGQSVSGSTSSNTSAKIRLKCGDKIGVTAVQFGGASTYSTGVEQTRLHASFISD